MEPAELKRLIDEAAAAVQPAAGGQGAEQPPRSAATPKTPNPTATPWAQGGGARRRGRPTLSRKSPFEGASPQVRDNIWPSWRQLPRFRTTCTLRDAWSTGSGLAVMLKAASLDCRPRRQAEEASPAVEPMTSEEIEAAARKLGKQPEAWLRDARDRGILTAPGQIVTVFCCYSCMLLDRMVCVHKAEVLGVVDTIAII